MARASEIRCRMPCEYWPTRRVQLRIEPHGADRAGTARVVADAIQTGEIAEVLHGAEFVVEQRGVPHVANARGHVPQVMAAKARATAAASGLQQAGDDAQQGGFAGAVFAQDQVEFAGFELGAHSAQRREASVMAYHASQR